MRSHVRFAIATGAIALTLIVASCGGSAGSSGSMPGMNHTTAAASTAATSAAAVHNDADAMFSQNMIVHHRGAIEMAALATTRASSTQVKDLAASIEAAQGPEITLMTGWLKAWGQSAGSGDSMSGMDHASDGSDAMGMMSGEQLKALKASTGGAFDRMFLTMMTVHHQGAIAMAVTEQADGSNPQAIALAKSIQTSQSSEVTQMNEILQGL